MGKEITVNIERTKQKWTYAHKELPDTGRPVLVARMREGKVVSRGFDHHDGAEWVDTHPHDIVYAWRDIEAPPLPDGAKFSGQRSHT